MTRQNRSSDQDYACQSIQCDFKISPSRHLSKTRVCWGLKSCSQTWRLSRLELGYVWTHPSNSLLRANSPSSRINVTQLIHCCLLPRVLLDILVELTQAWSPLFQTTSRTHVGHTGVIKMSSNVFIFKWKSEGEMQIIVDLQMNNQPEELAYSRLHCVFFNNAYSEWMNRFFQCNWDDLQ